MDFKEIVEVVGNVIDAAGVAVILIGMTVATASFVKRWWTGGRRQSHASYRLFRASVGRSILLGLEFLIAGDIIRTVALDLTYQNLGTLAILVLIRSFLSINLEMEIEGRWPWRVKRKPLDAPREQAEATPIQK